MAKKRSNGEGSVRRRGNGWCGELMDGYTSDGKRKMVYFSGSTKSQVLQKMKDYRRLSAQEHIHLDTTMLFADWADMWFEDYRSQVQSSTYSSYQYTLKHLKEHFGNERMADIRPIHINHFQDALRAKPYSNSMISKCRAMLIQIFDAAVSNGIIARNPARDAKKLRNQIVDPSDSKKDAFTDAEVEHMLSALPDDILGHSIRFLLGTGLRVQELLALSGTDINEDCTAVAIHRAIKMVNGVPQLGTPKSKRGYRMVPIPPSLRVSAAHLRLIGGTGLIWRGTNKKHDGLYSVGAFRRRFYRALKEIGGVRLLSPHCCRHTYVTRLQAQGTPLELIAKLAGHSSIETTDGYAHTSFDTLAMATNKLDNL